MVLSPQSRQWLLAPFSQSVPSFPQSATQSETSSCVTLSAVCDELRSLTSIGLPLIFSGAAKRVQDLLTAVLVARFDTFALASISQASVWTAPISTMFKFGIQQLSTLCGQAAGAGNPKLVGIWLQIFIVFVCIAFVPVAGSRWLTCPLLLVAGIRPHLAEASGRYAVWSMFAFLFENVYLAVKEYYAAQYIVKPEAFIDCVFTFVNFASIFTFLYVFKLGVVGVAISNTIVRCIRLIVLVLYCYHQGYHLKTWPGWSREEIVVWDRWITLLKLTFPAAIGGMIEEIQFQLCSLLAGRMGHKTSASFALILKITNCCMVISMSVAGAAGIRLSRHLGNGDVEAGRLSSHVGILSASLVQLCLSACYVCLVRPFGLWSSTDAAVQEQIYSTRWVVASIIAILGPFMSTCTVITKQGRAQIVAWFVSLGTWLVGVPMSVLLSSFGGGLTGIYQGIFLGYSLSMFCLIWVYFRTDWLALTHVARQRSEADLLRSKTCPAIGETDGETDIGNRSKSCPDLDSE